MINLLDFHQRISTGSGSAKTDPLFHTMQNSSNAVSDSLWLMFDFRIRRAIILMLLLCFLLSQCYAFESKFPRVCVIDNIAFKSEAQNVARSLSLPLTSEIDDKDTELFSHALSIVEYKYEGVSSYALAIDTIDTGGGKKSKTRRSSAAKRIRPSKKPFFIDFLPSRSGHMGKRNHGESGPDLLVKAVAPQRAKNNNSVDGAVVLDATAGFGADSLILAMSGASHVYMVERDPIIGSLLDDALRRLQLLATSSTDAELVTSLSKRLTLIIGDGKEQALEMSELEDNQRPDVVCKCKALIELISMWVTAD